jgi:TPR repeat protein
MKSILSPLVAAILLFASSSANDIYSEGIISTNKQEQAPNQKELNNLQDYNSMIEDLKQGAALGDADSNFYLGFVYINGVTLKDGTVVPAKVQEGKIILLHAISIGSTKALGVLAAKSIESSSVEQLTEAVKTAQLSDGINIENKDYYTLMLASLILDKNSDDANAIEVATKWIYDAEKKRPTAKMQYILASMYAKLQNIDAANYYLNKSCLDPQMNGLCQQFRSDSIDGGKSEQTCQKL